jgi:SAM-dependent methyltransferase
MCSDDQKSFRATRGHSFGNAAQAYAAHRPDYPDTAVEWALAPVTVSAPDLLDLAAGTGKLTAALIPRAGSVTAVEPDLNMLEVLRTQLSPPHGPVTALAGEAEEIPLPDASMDAVLVGQAFHWFDPDRAGAEIARVLRPGGVLAALWNAEDISVDWVAGYHRAVGKPRRLPFAILDNPNDDVPQLPGFDPVEWAEFDHSRLITLDGLIDLLGTHTWALLSRPEERAEVYQRVRAYLATRSELGAAEGRAFELPMRTLVGRTLRR